MPTPPAAYLVGEAGVKRHAMSRIQIGDYVFLYVAFENFIFNNSLVFKSPRRTKKRILVSSTSYSQECTIFRQGSLEKEFGGIWTLKLGILQCWTLTKRFLVYLNRNIEYDKLNYFTAKIEFAYLKALILQFQLIRRELLHVVKEYIFIRIISNLGESHLEVELQIRSKPNYIT